MNRLKLEGWWDLRPNFSSILSGVRSAENLVLGTAQTCINWPRSFVQIDSRLSPWKASPDTGINCI
jgi:hypothetical protein